MMKTMWLGLAMVAIHLGVVASEGNDDKIYNILAIDGGGIRGIIPAQVLLNIEKYAYEYAKTKDYKQVLNKYKDKDGKYIELVHMQDMFDMMAGTSTGSIISAALAYPHPEDKDKAPAERRPWYFMQEVMNIYTKTGDKIFVASSGSGTAAFVIFILMVAACVALGCSFNYKFFNYTKHNAKIEELKSKGGYVKLTNSRKDEYSDKIN